MPSENIDRKHTLGGSASTDNELGDAADKIGTPAGVYKVSLVGDRRWDRNIQYLADRVRAPAQVLCVSDGSQPTKLGWEG